MSKINTAPAPAWQRPQLKKLGALKDVAQSGANPGQGQGQGGNRAS